MAAQQAQASALLREYLTITKPTVAQARNVFAPLTKGWFSDAEIAALLVAINTRGATAEDIAGAAQAFVAKATPLPTSGEGLVDCCGTGGDGAKTINVSTTAGLLAAAMGIAMVKHGNRSVSSQSGSADVLQALGIPLDLSPEQAAQAVRENNFAFLFAPRYHPAIAHVMPVRKALAIPTIFNILGPLLNPAAPSLQLMGIADPAQGPVIIEVLRQLGRNRALVVHGSGIDEIAVHGATTVWELHADGTTSSYELTPEALGLERYELSDLVGGDGETNATITKAILAGDGTPAQRAAVAANTGALLYLAGKAATLAEGVQQAAAFLDSGQALATMDLLAGANN
ncbi:anthranilate phosphoribosyltransferase [Corynebacterium choanae]|uniref:anthranilate phosphoribosyltransferase n=1 Tax=Corynebacterium choanae TaxID=1862358 RepID=UPI00361C92CD